MAGQVVLVTGCGSGFGLLAAVEAAKRGHTVYAGLRRLEAGARLTEAAEGLDVRPIQLDVTRPEERTAAVEKILEAHGRIDGLVNNAGRPLGGFLETVDEDELRSLFDVNVVAPWALTRACLPAMRAQGRGTVVMISSMSGRMALPGLGAYAASKFALEGMSEAWRHELAPFGVRVVLIEPGPYRTDILGRNRALARNAEAPDSPYAAWTRHLDRVLEARMDRMAGDPAEVAGRICDVLEAARPALRHPMGRGSAARSLLLRTAPFGLVERIVARLARPPG
jgi:NAD(P)-dependent dehydrogenase (short-subunit alcohol dehydrogenase family)